MVCLPRPKPMLFESLSLIVRSFNFLNFSPFIKFRENLILFLASDLPRRLDRRFFWPSANLINLVSIERFAIDSAIFRTNFLEIKEFSPKELRLPMDLIPQQIVVQKVQEGQASEIF